MAAEVGGVGERADDPVAGGAVWVGHQALVGALRRSDRTPHLGTHRQEVVDVTHRGNAIAASLLAESALVVVSLA